VPANKTGAAEFATLDELLEPKLGDKRRAKTRGPS
jgi:hypothetical protein